MIEQLEDELTRVLRARAALISTAPQYRLVPGDAGTVGERPAPPGRPRRGWLLAVAAVTLLVVALGFYGGWIHANRKTPTGAAVCRLTDSHRFRAELATGLLPTGTQVLATGSDGSLLIGREHGAATSSIDVIDAQGAMSRVWTARTGQRVQALANPAEALNQYSAVFTLRPLDASASWRMILVRRTGGPNVELAALPGYRPAATPHLAPVLSGDSIEVIETPAAGGSAQRLVQYWDDRPLGVATGSQPVSDVVQLLTVGGNTVLLKRPPRRGTELVFDDPQYEPATLASVVREGRAFDSDGSTLTWLSETNGHHYLWRWSPADPRPQRLTLPAGLVPTAATGGYVATGRATASRQTLVDTATGEIAQLPTGVSLVRVSSGIAVLARHSTTGIRYARVATTALSC